MLTFCFVQVVLMMLIQSKTFDDNIKNFKHKISLHKLHFTLFGYFTSVILLFVSFGLETWEWWWHACSDPCLRNNLSFFFLQDGRADVIANDLGDRVTPCYVAFTEHDIVCNNIFFLLIQCQLFGLWMELDSLVNIYWSYKQMQQLTKYSNSLNTLPLTPLYNLFDIKYSFWHSKSCFCLKKKSNENRNS